MLARSLLTALIAAATLALGASARAGGKPDAGAPTARDAGDPDRELRDNLELLQDLELLQNLDLVAPPRPDAGDEE